MKTNNNNIDNIKNINITSNMHDSRGMREINGSMVLEKYCEYPICIVAIEIAIYD